jgi:hypothetical protein
VVGGKHLVGIAGDAEESADGGRSVELRVESVECRVCYRRRVSCVPLVASVAKRRAVTALLSVMKNVILRSLLFSDCLSEHGGELLPLWMLGRREEREQ